MGFAEHTSIAIAVVLAGCGEQAVLDVTVELDGATECEAFARVDLMSGQADEPWPEDAHVTTFTLGTEPSTTTFSVVAHDDRELLPVFVSIRACRAETCDAEASPGCPADVAGRALRVELERAFYLGEATHLTLDLANATTDRAFERIPKCAVAGCTDGAATTYCDADRVGRHFCE